MLAVPATTLPPWGSWVAEMVGGVCDHVVALPEVKPSMAQAQACAQRRGATPCSGFMGGAFLIMWGGGQKGWLRLNHNRSQR